MEQVEIFFEYHKQFMSIESYLDMSNENERCRFEESI